MIRNHHTALLYLVATALAGCSSTTPPPIEFVPRPLGRELPSVLSGDTATALPFAEPSGTVTLHQALSAALLHHPRLAATAWSVRAREAEMLQASLRPNPQIGLETENVFGSGDFSGFDAAETTLHLSQLFELGGKRQKRMDLASSAHELASWDAETVRLDVLTETTHSFIDVLWAQEQLTIVHELVEVAERLLESVSRRVRAGSVSPVEQSRALVELESSRVELERVRHQFTILRHRLASHWGSVDPQFVSVRGSLENTQPVPAFEAIAPFAQDAPELARWRSEKQKLQASLDLAVAEGRPDLQVQAGLRDLPGDPGHDQAFLFGLGIPLPLFDRNQGAARAAEYRLQRAHEEQHDAEITVRSALVMTHQQLQASEVEVQTLRERVLPEAERAFTTAQTAYQRGALRLSDVLDTERQLFELRSRYFRALAQHHHAAIDLERMIGRSLQQTGKGTP